MTPTVEIQADVRIVPLAQIRENPKNPRKHYSEAKMSELIDSVREHRILEPPLVRPIADMLRGHIDEEGFEIVFGHRRVRAAAAVGLDRIPVVVRDLTDAQAYELMLVENIQREDLDPIEESEGFRALIDDLGYTVESLIHKIGKSAFYVYGRLKLALLPDVAKQSLNEGRLPLTTAVQIARIPVDSLRDKAAREIVFGGEYIHDLNGGHDADGGVIRLPMSIPAARRHIEQNYMLKLSLAPFDAKDAALLADVGACTTCPKLTGNSQDLFPDIHAQDLCCDPDCFARKKEANWQRARSAAAADGKKIIEGKETKQLFSNWGNREVSGNAGYVDLKAKCPQDPKNRTWAKVLGKQAPDVAIAKDDLGRVRELVPAKEAIEILEQKGIMSHPAPSDPSIPSTATDSSSPPPVDYPAIISRLVGSASRRGPAFSLRIVARSILIEAGGVEDYDAKNLNALGADIPPGDYSDPIRVESADKFLSRLDHLQLSQVLLQHALDDAVEMGIPKPIILRAASELECDISDLLPEVQP
jgi:ParB/RepB/Spo0J family partition protein